MLESHWDLENQRFIKPNRGRVTSSSSLLTNAGARFFSALRTSPCRRCRLSLWRERPEINEWCNSIKGLTAFWSPILPRTSTTVSKLRRFTLLKSLTNTREQNWNKPIIGFVVIKVIPYQGTFPVNTATFIGWSLSVDSIKVGLTANDEHELRIFGAQLFLTLFWPPLLRSHMILIQLHLDAEASKRARKF